MKITTTIIAACMCIALVNSVPLKGFQSQALDDLMTAESNEEVSPLRNKRTIGVLRQLFPEVSKMIEDKVNLVVGEVLKIFGPIVFQTILKNNNNAGGAAGGGGGAKAGASGTSVAAKNPFDDDDEFKSFVDDDDWFSKPVANNTVPKATTRKTEVIASSTTTTATTAEPEVATVAGTNEETTISELDRVTTNLII